MEPITIFGKATCSYCRLAKELCENKGLNFRYVDIEVDGISQADLEKTVGKPVLTVPQIFHGREYIGGYEQFSEFLQAA
jgi:glutaredoxin 1